MFLKSLTAPCLSVRVVMGSFQAYEDRASAIAWISSAAVEWASVCAVGAFGSGVNYRSVAALCVVVVACICVMIFGGDVSGITVALIAFHVSVSPALVGFWGHVLRNGFNCKSGDPVLRAVFLGLKVELSCRIPCLRARLCLVEMFQVVLVELLCAQSFVLRDY